MAKFKLELGSEIKTNDVKTIEETKTSSASGNISTSINGANNVIISAYVTVKPAESSSYSNNNIALLPYFVPASKTWVLAVIDVVSLKKIANTSITYNVAYKTID